MHARVIDGMNQLRNVINNPFNAFIFFSFLPTSLQYIKPSSPRFYLKTNSTIFQQNQT